MKTLFTPLLALLSGLFLMLSSTAFAHTGLKSSWPANEQILTEAPQQLSLNFQSGVRLAKVTVLNGQEQELDINFKPVMQLQKDFKLALPTLEASQYRVTWMVMGDDGHKMEGRFQFTVIDEETPDTGSEGETENHNEDHSHDSHEH